MGVVEEGLRAIREQGGGGRGSGREGKQQLAEEELADASETPGALSIGPSSPRWLA